MSYIKFKGGTAPSITPNADEYIIFMSANGDLKYKDQNGDEMLVGGATLTDVVDAVTNNFLTPITNEVDGTDIINTVANGLLNRGEIYQLMFGPHIMFLEAIASDRLNTEGASLIMRVPKYDEIGIYNAKFTYTQDDYVTYNGSVYISTGIGNLGQAVTTESWELVDFSDDDYYTNYITNCKYDLVNEHIYEIADKIGNIYTVSFNSYSLYNEFNHDISTIGSLHGSQFIIGAFMWGNANWYNNKISESFVYSNRISHFFSNSLDTGANIFNNYINTPGFTGFTVSESAFNATICNNKLIGNLQFGNAHDATTGIYDNVFGGDDSDFVSSFIPEGDRLSYGSEISRNSLQDGSSISGNKLAIDTNDEIGSIFNNRLNSNSSINNNILYGGSINENAISESGIINSNELVSNGVYRRTKIFINNLAGKYGSISNNSLYDSFINSNNTIGISCLIDNNTLSDAASIDNNTIDSNSDIKYNVLETGSSISENILNGSYASINNNDLQNSSDIYANKLGGAYSYISDCLLGGGATASDEWGDLNDGGNCYIGGCKIDSTDGYIESITAINSNYSGLYGVSIGFGGLKGIKFVGQFSSYPASMVYTKVNCHWVGLPFNSPNSTVLRDSYIESCIFDGLQGVGGLLHAPLFGCNFTRVGLVVDLNVLFDPYNQSLISSVILYQTVDELSSSFSGFVFLNVGLFTVSTAETSHGYSIGLESGILTLPESYRIFNDLILGTTEDATTFGTSYIAPTLNDEFTIIEINYVADSAVDALEKDYEDKFKVKLIPGFINVDTLASGYTIKINFDYFNNAIGVVNEDSNLYSNNGVPTTLLYSEHYQDSVEFTQYKQQQIGGYGDGYTLKWIVSNYFTNDNNQKVELVDKTIYGVESKVIAEVKAATTTDDSPTNIISLKLYYNIVDVTISLVGSTIDGQYLYENAKVIFINTVSGDLSLITSMISFESTNSGSTYSGTAWGGYTYSIISASPSTDYNIFKVDVIGVVGSSIVWSAKVEGHGVLGVAI